MGVTPFQQVLSFWNPTKSDLPLYLQCLSLWQAAVLSKWGHIQLGFSSNVSLHQGLHTVLTGSESLLIFVFALGHVLIVSFIHSLFYCAHWQTYVSGTLQFGYVDVTEGQIVVMGVMLISSLEDFLDIDIWMSSVSTELILVILETTFLSLALLLHPQPAGDPLWCCLWHLLHVQGDQSENII